LVRECEGNAILPQLGGEVRDGERGETLELVDEDVKGPA